MESIKNLTMRSNRPTALKEMSDLKSLSDELEQSSPDCFWFKN
jgi:hypothetical protein